MYYNPYRFSQPWQMSKDLNGFSLILFSIGVTSNFLWMHLLLILSLNILLHIHLKPISIKLILKDNIIEDG